jgi:hypothetical protein
MRQEVGDQKMLTNCSGAMVDNGESEALLQ